MSQFALPNSDRDRWGASGGLQPGSALSHWRPSGYNSPDLDCTMPFWQTSLFIPQYGGVFVSRSLRLQLAPVYVLCFCQLQNILVKIYEVYTLNLINRSLVHQHNHEALPQPLP